MDGASSYVELVAGLVWAIGGCITASTSIKLGHALKSTISLFSLVSHISLQFQ
jgi:hypothetical protein